MNKKLLITTLIFFMIVNSAYYWEGRLGIWTMPVTLALLLTFVILGFELLYEFFLSAKEKFKSKTRIILISIMSVVLGVTIYKPFGLINFVKFEGKDILIAEREGAANCMTTFKLKENNEFTERSVCFGVTEIKGNYLLKGDTIFFTHVELDRHENEYYKFAVIKHSGFQNKNIIGELVRYKKYNDTLAHELWITKNELKEKIGQKR